MKSISFWAKQHYIAARWLITFIHILLFIAAVYVGVVLEQMNFALPALVCYIALAIFCMAALLHLLFKNGEKSYYLQRSCYFVIAATTFVCTCFLYNSTQRVASFNNYNQIHGIYKESKSKTPTNTVSKKQLRKELKQLRHELRKLKNNDDSEKVIGIILVIVGAFVLLSLLAALCCSLSCSGAEAVAVLVGLLGLVGIIWLSVWAIKKITKKKAAPAQKNTQTITG